MLDIPLRVGLSGATSTADGVAFQVAATEGMDLAWQSATTLDELEEKLSKEPVDVFVDACGDTLHGAESALIAIENNAHVILTDPRVDVAFGLTLQTEAQQKGCIVTSDAGTPHGTLASMIQEAHIMGFKTIQAGQFSPRSTPTAFLYEMAALANAFGFLPPDNGMQGPEISHLSDALSAFDLDNYGETPRIDFLKIPSSPSGLYLIVKAKSQLPAQQINHLRHFQLGDGPYYLLQRKDHLGYFETPKAILAAAAGQAILSPGPLSCNVYATLQADLPSRTRLKESHLKAQLSPHTPSRVPLLALLEAATLKSPLTAGSEITFDHIALEEDT